MTVSERTAQAVTSDDRAAWSEASVRPLWEIEQAHAVAEHDVRSAVWPWRTMEPLTRRALALTSPEVAERRVLSFIAPDARPGEFHTITNLNAGLQILAPGERARPHRHSPDALRFVLDGQGALTRVDGKVAPMQFGDLVLTPGNCWHEHWHEGTAPIVWLDVLNVHTHLNLGTFVFEPGPPHDVPALPNEDEFRISGILPDVATMSHSPLFRYSLESVVAALASAPLGVDGAKRVRYVNPQTGGPVMSLLDCWMIALEPGVATRPFRTNAHGVGAVVHGAGRTTVGNHPQTWEARDVFTLPSDAWITHEAEEPALLFVVSDRELYRNLSMLTAEFR